MDTHPPQASAYPDPDLCVMHGHLGGEFMLFGVGGLLMVSFHCVGMCGPLIMAFRFGSEGSTTRRACAAAGQLLCYQSGRLMVYLMAGALVGMLGLALHYQLQAINNVLALVMAGIFALIALGQLGVPGFSRTNNASSPPGILGRVMRGILDRWRGRPYARAFALGVAMGFLPCMLVFWTLGLAASRAHPLDGAILMALLIVLTTPVLLLTAISPMLIHRYQAVLRDRVSPFALLLSAVWLMLIGLAANGVIAHQSLTLGPWTVMFW
ncbi:MAG: sulfite exporter TauE/SafE family protein [Planctomycetota bacterium]|nr:MAG: sulfite exporter TauE/SafE family protein [Planctomycetota bacterium]